MSEATRKALDLLDKNLVYMNIMTLSLLEIAEESKSDFIEGHVMSICSAINKIKIENEALILSVKARSQDGAK